MNQKDQTCCHTGKLPFDHLQNHRLFLSHCEGYQDLYTELMKKGLIMRAKITKVNSSQTQAREKMICLLGGVYKRLQVLGKKRGTTISIVKQKQK